MLERYAGRGIRVLVAGLSERSVGDLEKILGGRRLRLIEAETFVEAWRRLHEAVFDVLIAAEDSAGGWQDLIAETAAMGPDLPVVLASDKADNRLWVDALSAGAYDVLEMPFHPAETRRVVLAACQHRRRATSHLRRRSVKLGGFGRRTASITS